MSRPAETGAARSTPERDGGGRIDLHAHTDVSDGTLSPEALARAAHEAGLVALAVTDHDHVGGVEAARREGARLGLEVVTGIELSAEEPGAREVHVLGYLLDERDPALLTRLASLRETRERRAELMVERLQALGVEVTLDDVQTAAGGAEKARAGSRSVGRPHVARALMARGVVASVQEAFDRYLAEGRPAYVPKEKLSGAEAIQLIHGAGGVAVLAHPATLPEEVREPLVRRLAALGLDGVEVVHSKQGPEERARLAALAVELDLVPTGGSDFHGSVKPDVMLGSGRDGNVSVGVDTLDALKRRKAERSA